MQHRKITILLILIGILYSTSSNAQIDSVTDNSQKVTVLEPPIFEFPGGSDSLYRFIDKNLNLTFKRMTVVGSVFVKFTVQKDGSITDIKY